MAAEELPISKPKMPPEWVPENHLEELVRSYGRVSPEIDAEFYREFLKADVVTLGETFRFVHQHRLPGS